MNEETSVTPNGPALVARREGCTSEGPKPVREGVAFKRVYRRLRTKTNVLSASVLCDNTSWTCTPPEAKPSGRIHPLKRCGHCGATGDDMGGAPSFPH